MGAVTARDVVETWRQQVRAFLDNVKSAAQYDGWNAWYETADNSEDPFNIGASITYQIDVLRLERAEPTANQSQQVTFEPRHRNALGSAGRIDVFSFPSMREAMLLRVPSSTEYEKLTSEDAERLVEETPWEAYSQERLPLKADVATDEGIRRFLNDLVAAW